MSSFAFIFLNGSKKIHNLRLFDLTKASPNMLENFIQGQDLNNLQWLCLCKCMIQKLPNNLFNYCHLQVFHLMKYNCLNFIFKLWSHGLNMSICVDMNELFTFIGKLIALLEFNLLGCSSLQELLKFIDQLSALQNLHLSRCSKLQELSTSIDQLSALQKLHLSSCWGLQKSPTSNGQLIALQDFHLSSYWGLQ